MTVQDIYLEDYDWSVRLYYDVSPRDAREIISFLDQMDYNTPLIDKVDFNIRTIGYNGGITVFNKADRHSTIMIIETTNCGEFFNSLIHELKHLVDFIGTTEHISLTGEELAYMIGDVGMMLFPKAGQYLCGCYK